MNEELPSFFMHQPVEILNYRPAIELLLNVLAGNCRLMRFEYNEGRDIWYISVVDNFETFHDVPIMGSLVRASFAAVKRGVTSLV